jgi:RHS repeat-associated protein
VCYALGRTPSAGPHPRERATRASPDKARAPHARSNASTCGRDAPLCAGASPQLNPVAELDGDGALVWQFVYGSKANVPDVAIRASDGAMYRIVSDQLGSPVLVVNASDSEDVLLKARYGAFGEQTVLGGSADAVPFGFAGGLYDADTGLVRFGARDYDPVIGRWVSKDPILYDGDGPNLYVYVLNGPTSRIDLTGEGFVDCAKAIARYLECKEKGNRSLDNRRAENECDPDRGHQKAIEQKNRRCERLRQQAFNACKDPTTWGPLLVVGGVVGVVATLASGGTAALAGAGAAAAGAAF